MIGTLINVVAILLGTALGTLIGSRIPNRTRTLVTDALGLVSFLAAAGAAAPGAGRAGAGRGGAAPGGVPVSADAYTPIPIRHLVCRQHRLRPSV